MNTPELPKDKGSVLADFLAWAKFSKASRITSVIGGKLKESPNGATLVIDRPPLRLSTPTPIGKLLITGGSEAGKYRITDGVVNSETPTLAGVDIGGDPDATPVVAPPEFTVTDTTYAWIKCVGVFDVPDTYTVTIHTQTAAGTPTGTEISTTGFTSFFYIGRVTFTAGSPATYAITNEHTGGNLGVESFGNINLWWKR